MDLIAAIKVRLRDQVPALRQIDGAIELDDVINNEVRVDTPAAFLVPLSDVPTGDESFDGPSIQCVRRTVAVVLCLDNYRDELGTEVVHGLNILRLAVRQVLLGWMPDLRTRAPMRFGRGQMLNFLNGRTWWSDEYRVETYWSETCN